MNNSAQSSAEEYKRDVSALANLAEEIKQLKKLLKQKKREYSEKEASLVSSFSEVFVLSRRGNLLRAKPLWADSQTRKVTLMSLEGDDDEKIVCKGYCEIPLLGFFDYYFYSRVQQVELPISQIRFLEPGCGEEKISPEMYKRVNQILSESIQRQEGGMK